MGQLSESELSERASRAAHFLDLHHGATPLLLPNPWDCGTAKVLASLGFAALATTSAGHAATLGRLDGGVDRGAALAHSAVIVAATDLPVSADLENGFADDPAGVATTISDALTVGLSGCSIEDSTGRSDMPLYDSMLASERVAAAAEAAHAGPVRLVLTARCENHLHGHDDLADTIARLQSYEAAGADVVYAPGITTAEQIRSVVTSVGVPVNVLALPGVPSVAELAELGVARVSIGSGFSNVALSALVGAAREFLDEGTYGFWGATAGMGAVRAAFG